MAWRQNGSVSRAAKSNRAARNKRRGVIFAAAKLACVNRHRQLEKIARSVSTAMALKSSSAAARRA